MVNGGGSCFHPRTKIKVLVGGKTMEKSISEIKEGDLILTFNKPAPKFVKVKKNEKFEGEFNFLNFKLKSLNSTSFKEIKVTEAHIMILLNTEGKIEKLILAKNVEIGQHFWTEDGIFEVVEIGKEKGRIKYTLSVEDEAVFADGIYLSSLGLVEMSESEKALTIIKTIDPVTSEVRNFDLNML